MEKKTTILVVAITIICMAVSPLQAQKTGTKQTISGIVMDSEFGKLLPGTNVFIKTASYRGTVTDINGKFTISAAIGEVVVFQMIGMKRYEYTVTGSVSDLVILLGAFQPAQSIYLTTQQREKIQANNSLAFQMFRKVSKQEGDNTFFSPWSFSMALGMLYNGASGNTRYQIAETLGIAHFSETEINEYFQKIAQAFLQIDPSTEITIANSFWYRNDFSVKDRFVEINKKYFEATVQALDLSSTTVSGTINNNTISDDMILFLSNALYFRSKWRGDMAFHAFRTRLDDFTKTNNQKQQVYMMEQFSWLYHYADEYMQLVELVYGNGAFSMVVVLPSEDMDINQLIDRLDNDKWQYAINGMQDRWTQLRLPRFKVEGNLLLNQPIKSLGMGNIFSEGFANISDDNLWISGIQQQTFVEVNEASTRVQPLIRIIVGGGWGEPVPFFANRPFLYVIREKSTGVILFMGRMDNPNKQH